MATRRRTPAKGTTPEGAPPPTPDPKREPPAIKESIKAKRPEWANKLIKALSWVVGISLVLIGVGALIHQSQEKGPKIEKLYPPVDTTAYHEVWRGSVYFSLKKPFYTTVEYDSLQAGDQVHVAASGAGGWDRYYRFHGGDGINPEGWTKYPEDLKPNQNPGQFLIHKGKKVPMAALVGAFGKLDYDEENDPHLKGTQHTRIGKEATLIVPEGLVAPKLHVTLNERWIRTAWGDNWGAYRLLVTVRRPMTSPAS